MSPANYYLDGDAEKWTLRYRGEGPDAPDAAVLASVDVIDDEHAEALFDLLSQVVAVGNDGRTPWRPRQRERAGQSVTGRHRLD